MVSIHVMKRFWCGGVLYWHDLVITSASCLQLMHNNRFFRENPRVLQVRVGSNHSRVGGEMVDALEVYFNPGYNPRTLRNNIAVIRLRYRLFFSYHRLPKIIRISHSNFLVPYTSEVLLLGWGVIRATSKMRFEPVFMQRKVLPVYPNKFCKEVYGDKFVTEQMFCAGTMTTGEGACDHDAGGPAVLNGRLVGIISFGPTVCGFPNAPTVFTLVGAFSDWIETVNESMPAYYRNYKKTTSLTPSTFDFSYISAMLQSTTELVQTPANTMRTVFSPATTSPSDAGRHRMFKRHKLAAASPDAPCTFSISTRMLPPWIPTVKKPKFPFTETTEKSTTSKKFSISIRPLPEWVGTPDIPKWLNQTHEPPSFQSPAPPYRPPIPGETHPPPPTPNLDIATLFPKRFPYRPSTTHVVPNYGYTFSTASSPQWYFTLRRKAVKKSGRGRQ